MAQSEESITLMRSLHLPYHKYRFVPDAQIEERTTPLISCL
ncbi:hypothetical protein [Dialister invisus]